MAIPAALTGASTTLIAGCLGMGTGGFFGSHSQEEGVFNFHTGTATMPLMLSLTTENLVLSAVATSILCHFIDNPKELTTHHYVHFASSALLLTYATVHTLGPITLH